MSKLLRCIFPALLFGTACVAYGGEPVALKPGDSPSGAAKHGRLIFLGWGDQGRYVEPIRARLEQGGWKFGPDAPVVLEVILEEKRSTNELLQLLNFIATAASGTAIPFYNQVNYRLRFRSLREGRLLDSCNYELRNHEYFSLLLLPVAPFYWSTSVLRNRLENATDAFTAGCAR